MAESIDDETATMLLREYKGWFGPPRVEFGGLLIDGRIRFRNAISLGLGRKLPCPIVAQTTGDAAKYLCLAGHYTRAKSILPQEIQCASDAAAYCHCAPEIMAPLYRKSMRHAATVRGNNTARRREAIEGIARLLRMAERGPGYVTSDEIRKVLQPWL